MVIDKIVQELVAVFRKDGRAAASARYAELTRGAKAWEARAVREAFAKAVES
jgi:hypothetical protein